MYILFICFILELFYIFTDKISFKILMEYKSLFIAFELLLVK